MLSLWVVHRCVGWLFACRGVVGRKQSSVVTAMDP